MNRLICFLALFCLGHSLFPAVMPPEKREARIDAIQSMFPHFNNEQYDALGNISNVFLRVSQVDINEQVREDSTAPSIVQETLALSDRDILKMVAKQLKPTGRLILGNKKFLVLEGGKRLPLGMFIPVRIKGELHKIRLQSIKSDHFILSLNGETLKKVFKEEKLNGSLQFD